MWVWVWVLGLVLDCVVYSGFDCSGFGGFALCFLLFIGGLCSLGFGFGF